jgi:hypothetical protein
MAAWLLIMGAEFIHGVARATFLAPYVGDFRSRQIGVFTGSLLILLIASLTVRRIRADRTSLQMVAGSIWLVLTVAFELSFGHFILGLPWDRLAADYDIPRGGLLPFGLIWLTLSPLAAARLSVRRSSVSRRSESTAGRAA